MIPPKPGDKWVIFHKGKYMLESQERKLRVHQMSDIVPETQHLKEKLAQVDKINVTCEYQIVSIVKKLLVFQHSEISINSHSTNYKMMSDTAGAVVFP